MLQLSGYLLHKPVLSLRTGGAIAWTTEPIINPRNLKVEGFHCKDSVDGKTLILLYQDIREVSKRGFIVDDLDALVEPDELVRLKDVLDARFQLMKKPVETTGKDRIGKVSDYAVETTTMFVQKLYVSRSLWRSLTGGSLSIDRTQIVEITNRRVIINDLLQPTPAPAAAVTA
jgi:uncharacterized protein YrrD